MGIRTDDRVIRDTQKNNPEAHAEQAKRFINKMGDKLKKPGVTSKDRARIGKKMKRFDRIRKQFKSGEGLSDKRYFK